MHSAYTIQEFAKRICNIHLFRSTDKLYVV